MSLTEREQYIADLEIEGNFEEASIQRELRRLGIENAPIPESCEHCGGFLEEGDGMVGETLLFCPKCRCIAWCDQEQAIRIVY